MGPSSAGRADEFIVRVQRRPLLSLPDGPQVASRPKVPMPYVAIAIDLGAILFYIKTRLLFYFIFYVFNLLVDKLELNTAIDTFDAHGLRAQNDKVIDIPDMVTVLRSLYEVVVATYPGEIRLPLVIDLCLNWILNVYDRQNNITCIIINVGAFSLTRFTLFFFVCGLKFSTVKGLAKFECSHSKLSSL